MPSTSCTASVPRIARAARRLIERPRRAPERSPLFCVNFKNTRAFVFDRFEREAMTVSHLSHRYIVPIDGDRDGRRSTVHQDLAFMSSVLVVLHEGLRAGDAVEGVALFDSAMCERPFPGRQR